MTSAERGGAGSDAPPSPPDVSSGPLLATLGVAGAVAGMLIVFVYQGTQPAIQAYRSKVLGEAIEEVLGMPERYDTLYVTEDGLARVGPVGADGQALEPIYLGYRGDEPVGFAIAAGEPGFQDVIRLIFGYDPESGTVLGMKVLESKETPGLGDKIEKDTTFGAQFVGSIPPLVGVKRGSAGDDPSRIDMITGATISSRTVIRIIDNALERLGSHLTYEGLP